MKKYGSWTELVSLVLRTPTNNAKVKIDAADGFPGPPDTLYTYIIPSDDSATTGSDDFVLKNLAQTLRSKTAKQLVLTDATEAASVTLNPAATDTAASINLDLGNVARNITIGGTLTTGADFITGGAGALTLNPAGTATLGIPANTTGDVVVTDESQTLTNKILNNINYSWGTATIASNTFASPTETIIEVGGTGPLHTITGAADGKFILLVNRTGGLLTINNEQGAAVGSIITGTGENLELADDASVILAYENAANRWQVVGGAGGSGAGLKLDTLTGSGTQPAVAGTHYMNTSSTGTITLQLPLLNRENDVIRVTDAGNGWETNNVVVDPQGAVIDSQGAGETLILDINNTWVQFHWDGTKWTTNTAITPTTTPGVTGLNGGVLYNNGGIVGNADEGTGTLFWDDTNGRLGINKATPAVPLDVVGHATFTADTNTAKVALDAAATFDSYFDLDVAGVTRFSLGNDESATAFKVTNATGLTGTVLLSMNGTTASFGSQAVTAASFSGTGTSLTALNASNITSGTISNSYLPATINATHVGPGAIPLGAVIPVMDVYSNVSVAGTGTSDANGLQLCDGAALEGGHSLGTGLSGNTPNLTDGRFLRGSTVSGTTGGSATKNLSHSHTFAHTHGTDSQLGTITLAHTHGGSTEGATASWTSTPQAITVTANPSVNKNSWNSSQTAHSHTLGGSSSRAFFAMIGADLVQNVASTGSWSTDNFLVHGHGVGGTITGKTTASELTGSSNTSSVSWSSATVSATGWAGNFNKNTLNTNQTSHSHTINSDLSNYNAAHSHTTNSQSSSTTSTDLSASFNIEPAYMNVKYVIRIK